MKNIAFWHADAISDNVNKKFIKKWAKSIDKLLFQGYIIIKVWHLINESAKKEGEIMREVENTEKKLSERKYSKEGCFISSRVQWNDENDN